MCCILHSTYYMLHIVCIFHMMWSCSDVRCGFPRKLRSNWIDMLNLAAAHRGLASTPSID